MDELSLVLKVRTNAGLKAAALAEEVKSIPKLSVLAPHINGENSPEMAEGVLEQLQFQMELQNLQHAKEAALETVKAAINSIATIRSAVNEYELTANHSIENIVDDYDARIQGERVAYAELQQRQQDLLFGLNQKMSRLQAISEK